MAGGAANWARALTRAAIVIGTGVVLQKSRYNLSLTAATTPNEQQMYDECLVLLTAEPVPRP